jgi:hypothetical protein
MSLDWQACRRERLPDTGDYVLATSATNHVNESIRPALFQGPGHSFENCCHYPKETMNKILSTLIVTAFASVGAHAADKMAPLTPAVVAAPASAVAAASAVAPAASADKLKAKAQKLKDTPVKAEVMPPSVPATK